MLVNLDSINFCCVTKMRDCFDTKCIYCISRSMVSSGDLTQQSAVVGGRWLEYYVRHRPQVQSDHWHTQWTGRLRRVRRIVIQLGGVGGAAQWIDWQCRTGRRLLQHQSLVRRWTVDQRRPTVPANKRRCAGRRQYAIGRRCRWPQINSQRYTRHTWPDDHTHTSTKVISSFPLDTIILLWLIASTVKPAITFLLSLSRSLRRCRQTFKKSHDEICLTTRNNQFHFALCDTQMFACATKIH